jgi:hypothetical protein
MHNLLRSRKAQFYILSVVGIVTILYAIGKSLTPHIIIDTSDVVLRSDYFVFNNIVEKTLKTLDASKSCEDLRFNLEEFKRIATKAFAPDFRVEYSYSILSCDDTARSATVSFKITLYSVNSEIGTTFTKNVNW